MWLCLFSQVLLSGAAVPLLPPRPEFSFSLSFEPQMGKKPNVQRSPFLVCLLACLDTRCYAAYQLLNPKPPQIKYFPNPDPKITLLVEAEPVFEQGQCEDSSQDSKRSLFSFGPGEVYFPPLIIPALFSQQPSYLHSHSWRLLPYHTHRTYCRTEFGYEYCRYQVTGYELP